MGVVSVYPELKLGILLLQGHVTVPEVKQGYLDMMRHPQLGLDLKMFADARGVTEVTADFLSMLSATYSVKRELDRLSQESRCVMLVASDTNYGIARMFQQVVNSVSWVNIHIVSDITLAEQRLGLLPGQLTPLLQFDAPVGRAGMA
jgi:2-hydroxy-3-keto-5-methylthiopentenyl-1-phosphate phosphatase